MVTDRHSMRNRTPHFQSPNFWYRTFLQAAVLHESTTTPSQFQIFTGKVVE